MLPRLALLGACLGLQGCCALAGVLGCGPGSTLVPVSYDSPRQTLDTLLAAFRHGDTKVVYESLSEGFKEANGIDGLAFAIAWERVKKRVPGIHLAGDASVTEDKRLGPRRWHYGLETYGYRFEVVLVARPYWDVGRWEGGEVVRVGRYVGAADRVIDSVDAAKGRIQVRLDDGDLIGLERGDIAFVKAGFDWKVGSLQRVQN